MTSDYKRLKNEVNGKLHHDRLMRALIWTAVTLFTIGVGITCAGMYMFITGR